MYEVLALSMEIAGRPKEDIQRVVLSLTDFGPVDVERLLFSGAYLTRFGRNEAALRMYRQAARIAPERAEPYVLGLRLARSLKRPADVAWASVGALQFGWTRDWESLHREAENAAADAEQWFLQQGQTDEAAKLRADLAAARERDLLVTLTWAGDADLDLLVEEPAGTVCSMATPDSAGGGIHLHDGYGPAPDNCHERYVCPRGISGDYRIRVRHARGDVVGKRAQLMITQHAGTPAEVVTRETLIIGSDDAVKVVRLESGRRRELRTAVTSQLDTSRVDQIARRSRRTLSPVKRAAHEEQVLEEFRKSRQESALIAGQQQMTGAGSVGFQPVISTIRDGSFLRASAIVSPDRRYVRIAVNPTFSTLTDVFTFSFITGFGGVNTGVGVVGGGTAGGGAGVP
jgi:hypothetical protein